MIRITPNFTAAQIRQVVENKIEAIKQALILRLQKVGERFIINARNNNSYKDQTGNLRSSIGYRIYKDGVLVTDGFKGGKAEGKNKGQQVADDVISGINEKGIVIVFVAGMSYAAIIESRGLDVITASSITAKNDLKKSIAELNAKLQKV